MEAEGILTALAEVAIAITGFSGIVVALDRSDQPWSELEKTRLTMLLEVSISCVFFSFLPVLFYMAELSPPSIWFWSSGLWLVHIFVVFVYRLRQFPRLRNRDEEPSVRLVYLFMLVTSGISIVAQVANVGWLMSPWPHLLAVLQGLLFSCIFFVRLLRRFVGPAA